MNRFSLLLAGVGACAIAWPAGAQTQPATARAAQNHQALDDEGNTIVVTAGKPEGSVIGDIPPEVTLNPGDIRSFGVSSLSDLISELSPQTTSGQGRGGESPVVLLNGKRISSFADVRDIPVEAIQRVEILPEEVALKYGYRPTQKVVNIVLRKRFKAFTGELEAAMPTEGGQFSPQVETSFLHIGTFGRLNLAGSYDHSSPLYESERDIAPQTARFPYILTDGSTDTGAYRTLLPETDTIKLNAVLARTIFDNVSATFNGSLTYNESDSAQGLATGQIGVPAASPFSPGAGATTVYRYLDELGALGQQSRDITGHVGTTFNGAVGKWQWSLTGSFDHTASRTTTDRGYDLTGFQARIDALDPGLDPFAPLTANLVGGRIVDTAHSTSNVGNADLVVSGTLFALPAGAVTTSVKIGGALTGLDSRSERLGVPSSASLSRNDASGQISFDLPIASRKKGFLAPLGELSANINLAYDQLSDFGGLRTIGAGLTWTPVKPISLIVSIDKDEGAPTIQQLGNPTVATTGARVFDYIRGETVEVTRLSGGNPDLSADDRRIFKAGVTVKPLTGTDLSLTANYTNSRIQDPIASFPTATAAIEAAFPDRFTRDSSGQLIRIDSRPINFARQDQQQLRLGINFTKQLSTPPRPTGGPGQGQQPSLRELLPPGPNDNPNAANQRQGANGSGGNPGGPGGPGGFGGPGGPGGPGGGGGGGFGRGPGGRGTRLQLALYDTIYLRDKILIDENGPSLDLLHGDAIGSSGGQPRHEVQAQAGLTHNGLGARLSANWQSATTVEGGTSSTQSLRFSDLTTLNLRLFAGLGQIPELTKKWPFLRGSRLSLSVTNLFNARLHVRDVNGDTPVSYQPDYLDPLGRSIKISFRKLFF